MSNETFQCAKEAKDALRVQLGPRTWLRGIGIGFDDSNEHFVKVNVYELTDEVRAVVPNEVNGVRVLIDVVGNITAL